MTQAELEEIIAAAARVAQAPPIKRGKTTFAASEPWTRIDRLRAALDGAGVDWKDER